MPNTSSLGKRVVGVDNFSTGKARNIQRILDALSYRERERFTLIEGDHVPKEIVERPKTGFGIPVGEWLRGSMREWAEELLLLARMRDEGFLDPEPVRRTWEKHLAGARNHDGLLWGVLMFQAWVEKELHLEGAEERSVLS